MYVKTKLIYSNEYNTHNDYKTQVQHYVSEGWRVAAIGKMASLRYTLLYQEVWSE